jgi:hypothetical protein
MGKELKWRDSAVTEGTDSGNAAVIYSSPDWSVATCRRNPWDGSTNLNCVNAVDRGTGVNQRIGMKISIKKVQIRGYISQPPLAGTTGQIQAGRFYQKEVMVALVLDANPNGAAMVPSECYTSATHNGLCTSPFRNIEYIGRYRVLVRKKIKIPVTTVGVEGVHFYNPGQMIPFEIFFEFKTPLITTFSSTSTTSTIADIASNSIHVLANASHHQDDVPGASRLKIAYNCRVRYFD